MKFTQTDERHLPPEDEHIHLNEPDEAQPQHHDHHSVEDSREYVKFGMVLLGILVVSILVTTLRGWDGNRFANDFMAVFFMTFAAFKFVSLEEFALTYRSYDLLARRLRPWGYLFPFFEAFLGIGYFISTDAWQLNVLTLLLTGTAGYGVWKALKRKSSFHCACLGTVIKLPLTKVSFVENASMFVMAAVMLVL